MAESESAQMVINWLDQNQSQFIEMADQVFPTALVGTWFSVILVICLIAVPAATAFAASMPEKRGALLICVGYVVLSTLFLVIVR